MQQNSEIKDIFNTEIDVFEGMVSIRSVFEGIDKGVIDRKIIAVLFDENNVKGNGKLLGFLKARSFTYGYTLKNVPSNVINQYANGSSHGGVIMLCEKRKFPETVETPESNGFYVI